MTFDEVWAEAEWPVGDMKDVARWWYERATKQERERCAKIAEHFGQHHDFYDGAYDVAKKIAKRIREATGDKGGKKS